MRSRDLSKALAVAVIIGAVVLASTLVFRDADPPPSSKPAPAPSPSPADELPAPARAPIQLPSPEPPGVIDETAEVSVDVDGFLAWAAVDLTTGVRVASDNAAQTNSTESMIKAWIVADYLRRIAADGEQPSQGQLEDASRAIRDSHNGTTERMYVAGGRDAVVARMIDVCELTDTYTPPGDEGWWSRTEMSARDAVRLGQCILDGRAAGDEWTDWLLEEMRQVRGSTHPRDQRPSENFEGGRWGIIDGLPAETSADEVSIKNGWTRIGRTNSWHLNCLAMTDEWVMAVLMRYPADYPLDYGAERCAAVARQLLKDPPPEPGRLATEAL